MKVETLTLLWSDAMRFCSCESMSALTYLIHTFFIHVPLWRMAHPDFCILGNTSEQAAESTREIYLLFSLSSSQMTENGRHSMNHCRCRKLKERLCLTTLVCTMPCIWMYLIQQPDPRLCTATSGSWSLSKIWPHQP